MEVIQVPISKLKFADYNPRVHPEKAIEKLVKSIEFYGFTNPVLVQKKSWTIMAGHLRVKAAAKHGLKEVPAILLDFDDEKAMAYNIADNRLQDETSFDFSSLADLLLDLDTGFFDLEMTGFDLDEIEDIMTWTPEAGEVKGDDFEPEPPKNPRTKIGDLYVLGRHRLLCGDASLREDVDRLMDGQQAGLLFTSPPYDKQRDYKGIKKQWNPMMEGVFDNLPLADEAQILVNLGLVHQNGEVVPYWDKWLAWMRRQGFKQFGWYVWDQGFGLPGDWNGRLAPSHEFIFHFNRESHRPKKCIRKKQENIKARKKGDSTMRGKDGITKPFTSPEASAQPSKIPDSVLRINRMHGGHKIDHPAIFPVGLPHQILEAWPGKCYEPFAGSGTTMIAAEQLNRDCFQMEIAPAYCDVIVQRYADFRKTDPDRYFKKVQHNGRKR